MSVTFYVGQGSDDDLNVSNANFVRLMTLIDADAEEGAGTFDGAALLELETKVRFALDSVRAMPALDGGTPPTETIGPMGARIIDCGLVDGYFRDRLERLLNLITHARACGLPVRYA